MERSKLEEIIKNGENSGIEFKVEIEDTEDLAKEIVAFLNLKGGIILIGISDNGEIIGTEKDLEEWIMNVCRDLVSPPIIPFYEKIFHNNKTVIIITIPQGIDKPYCVFKNNRKTYYIRVGTVKREASREEIRRLYQASGQIHYDILPVHNSLPKDLVEERINEYFKDYRNVDIQNITYDEKIRILTNSGILINTEQGIVCSVGGVLLFGREPEKFLSQSGIIFAHYKGCDISDELIDRKDFNKTLVENIQDVCSAVKLNVPVPSKIIGLKREEEIFYPEKVVRESVVNACIHRDYTIYGAKIRVFLFDDKLIIRSPGVPPNTITIENMKIGYSVPRNPMLLKFMFDYHFIEGLGRGIPMIIKTMKEISGIEPEIKIEGEETIVTLYRKR